jgi:hypothetical protein
MRPRDPQSLARRPTSVPQRVRRGLASSETLNVIAASLGAYAPIGDLVSKIDLSAAERDAEH